VNDRTHAIDDQHDSPHEDQGLELVQGYRRVEPGVPHQVSAILDSDYVMRLMGVTNRAFTEFCFIKIANNGPNSVVDELPRNYFVREMCAGSYWLQESDLKQAFGLFDQAFQQAKPLVTQLHLQGFADILYFMARFPGEVHSRLFDRFLRYTSELVAVLAGPNNAVKLISDSFRQVAMPMDVTAEALLPCVLDVLQTNFGILHPNSRGVLQSFAWVLFHRGRLDEALHHFQLLARYQEEATGPNSIQTCLALRGLADTYLRRGEFDLAESVFDDVLGQRCERLGPVQQTSLKINCFRSLSELQQRRGNLLRARWLLRQAYQAAVDTFGEQSRKALNTKIRLDALDVVISGADSIEDGLSRYHTSKTMEAEDEVIEPPVVLEKHWLSW